MSSIEFWRFEQFKPCFKHFVWGGSHLHILFVVWFQLRLPKIHIYRLHIATPKKEKSNSYSKSDWMNQFYPFLSGSKQLPVVSQAPPLPRLKNPAIYTPEILVELGRMSPGSLGWSGSDGDFPVPTVGERQEDLYWPSFGRLPEDIPYCKLICPIDHLYPHWYQIDIPKKPWKITSLFQQQTIIKSLS